MNKMNKMNKIIQLLKKHEGLRLKPYRDTVNKLTIGVGRNLDDRGISEEEANFLLKNDINICLNELKTIFENFDEFPENIKLVLIDMIFNLGKSRFLTFKKFIKAIKEKDIEKAIYEMTDSRWCSELPSRCKDDQKLLKLI